MNSKLSPLWFAQVDNFRAENYNYSDIVLTPGSDDNCGIVSISLFFCAYVGTMISDETEEYEK